jgi:hypothetical protein
MMLRFRDTGHGTTKGIRQFGISHGLPGNFRRLYEGEPYIDQYKTQAIQQVSSKKKMMTSNGFRYSSPPKKANPGDYNGTFTKPYPHLVETDVSRGRREPVKVSSPRKIYTSPSKKSTHGLTPHLCFTDIPYISSDYEGDRKKRQVIDMVHFFLCHLTCAVHHRLSSERRRRRWWVLPSLCASQTILSRNLRSLFFFLSVPLSFSDSYLASAEARHHSPRNLSHWLTSSVRQGWGLPPEQPRPPEHLQQH